MQTLTPEAFGAVGDGITDDSAAIQAGIAEAGLTKQPLVFRPVTYAINTELGAVALHGIELRGCGSANSAKTILKAGTAIRSVLTMQSSYANVTGIQFDANRLATYALFLESSSFSKFEDCLFQKAAKDGINLSVIGINDANIFTNCWACDNGQIFCTSGFNATFKNFQRTAAAGTIACKAGDRTLVGTGTAFKSMGIRSGDFIRIGTGVAEDQFLQVSSVECDDRLVVGSRRVPNANLRGQGFAIAVGNGYTEVRHNDNNITQISGGLWRLNAGAGMMFNGLYGPKVTHPQIDHIGFYGIVLGTTDQEGIYSTVIDHAYFEGCLAAPILFGSAIGVTVLNPQTGVGRLPLYHMGYSAQNIGTWHDYSGIHPIGDAVSTIPVASSSATFTLGGRIVHRGENPGTISARVPIATATSLVLLSTSAHVTMSATPTFADGLADYQEILAYNQGAGDPITLQDESVLPGSNLRLAAGTITLRYKDSIRLLWVYGRWVQVGHTALV
jgi:hypothetical protein